MNMNDSILVGLDWADQKHDICWRDIDTGETQIKVLKHTPELINEWVCDLISRYPGKRIAVCLEQTRGPVVYALMGYDAVDIYPVNPSTMSDYRKAFSPSGAKDDPGDAALMLELLELHPESLKLLKPDTEDTRLLRSFCEDRRKAVDMRTALCSSMRSRLKGYFPQALKLVSEQLFAELTCAFLMKWPSFESVAAARPSTIRRFYYAHQSRSEKCIKERLELVTSSRSLCSDTAVVNSSVIWIQMIVKQIRLLNREIQCYDRRIKELFSNHDDKFIFEKLPGAGQQLAPRLLVAFGTDRDRYEKSVEVSNYFGISPVIVRSGKQKWVHWRWHCPKFIRQSVVEFAGKSIVYSDWARIYYEEQIKRGKGHHAAVRALAYKWIRVIFYCWKQKVAYDEKTYTASLSRHGSWIADRLKKTA
ncbi:MAG: transposase [Desulfoplanes sp.]|jgi:transposase